MMELHKSWDDYHRLRIERAIRNFDRKGFETHLFETATEAADFFFSEISPDMSIGYGGSDTNHQLGIMGRLKNEEYNFLDRNAFGHTYEQQLEIRRKTLSADVFISSSNAVSIDGALVNIDGEGNRVSAIGFGPGKVYVFVGRNKITDDLQRAIYRARNVAAVALAIQLGKNTPCASTGYCHDCNSPDRICSNLSIIEHCNPAGRISLIFINADLGL